jgi:hypothetical protein
MACGCNIAAHENVFICDPDDFIIFSDPKIENWSANGSQYYTQYKNTQSEKVKKKNIQLLLRLLNEYETIFGKPTIKTNSITNKKCKYFMISLVILNTKTHNSQSQLIVPTIFIY